MRSRWWVLLASVLLLVAGIAVMASGGITTTTNSENAVGDSGAAARIIKDVDFGEKPQEMIIATSRDGSLSDGERAAIAARMRASYGRAPGVAGLGEPVLGADGASVVLPVMLDATDATAGEKVPAIENVTTRFQAANPTLTIGQFGDASLRQQINKAVSGDFRRAEYTAVPITLLVLLIAFGSIIASGVPLGLGLGAVGVALGGTALWSRQVFAIDQSSQSLLLLIGLAVGVDYALFYLRRTREERATGASVEDSIALAGSSAGRAIIISGLTVITAMSGMLVAGGMFASLAVGTIIVVAVAVIASATTLPALLGILGDKVDALRLPGLRRRGTRPPQRSLWGRLARRVSRRPLFALAAVGTLMVALAVPGASMRTSLGDIDTLPGNLPGVQAYEQLAKAVPSSGTSLTMVVKAPASDAMRVEQALAAIRTSATKVQHVTGVASATKRSTDRTVTTLDIGVGLKSTDSALPHVVSDVRHDLVPQVQSRLSGIPGVQVHVGGEAVATDLTTWMNSRLPIVVGFVLLVTLFVMMISFGSPWLAVTTVLLNLLSVGAAYGVLTVVFQHSFLEGLLDFHSNGSVAAWIPTLMFVILFGLSMDYHVFVTSRVREAYDAGESPADAAAAGVARSAGVVTSAAAVMVGVFAVFGTLSMLEMKEMGVGLAAAVLIDATLVRGIMLPAALTVLGRRAHTGPAWLPTIHH